MFNQLSLFGLEQEVFVPISDNQYLKEVMNCDKTILDG
jgi:hypothetical protein